MNDKLKKVVIVGAARTPIGTYKGSLKHMKADQLGSIVIKEVLKKCQINRDEVDVLLVLLTRAYTLAVKSSGCLFVA